MLPQQYCLRWKYHHSNLQTMFSQLLDRGCFCDVTLACEGQLIRAHRVVLCACSSFFDTVLTNYASERDPIIIMKDVTFSDVKCLIEFMYKGEINVEHANLASLLKTADDLKIKGLAEVSWRDDEDGPPMPSAATEFHSPTQLHEMYAAHRAGSPAFMDHQQHHHLQQSQQMQRERKLSSPKATGQHLPTLTPIPPMPASAAAAATASASSPVENYLGPKRKRGRPPLDDAYDVFNVRKHTHYSSHLDAHHHHQQAYMEAQRHYNDEQRRLAVISPIPQPSSTTATAAAAYHHHIQQQQHNKRMRQLHREQQRQQHHPHHHQMQSDTDELDQEDAQADPEWITSNLEVNLSSGGDSESAIECGTDIPSNNEKNLEINDDKETNSNAPTKISKRKARSSEEYEREQSLERSQLPKRASADERDDKNIENDEHERKDQQSSARESRNSIADKPAERDTVAAAEKEEEQEQTVDLGSTVPRPVEEMEGVRHGMDKTNNSTSGNNTLTNNASSSHKRSSASNDHATTSLPPPPSLPSTLHHSAHSYGKYVPEGYLLNEHGMLMTHDYGHPSMGASLSSAGAGASSSSGVSGSVSMANGNDQEISEIKVEEYDVSEMRLTTEEISEWQDVIKMDDYLAKGRRPQFWEEPFTRRVLEAIKNKRLEMKKAARILGVSYGTLYGRYREVYGCLKHPYSTNFRPAQSNQVAAQPRLDLVWPSSKRDSALMPGPSEIGKIRPKDLSELWTRPQI
ncbi:longitudinals lacking protein, isoforms H/M/V isoform X2 [Eurosta solidaginis]|uniref:longitudinals lacking protein, isoforms H/M/V isoform X2 n=1 Tax=Eurosta solidaginis TaxID=178769 RepID=UPI0035311DB6